MAVAAVPDQLSKGFEAPIAGFDIADKSAGSLTSADCLSHADGLCQICMLSKNQQSSISLADSHFLGSHCCASVEEVDAAGHEATVVGTVGCRVSSLQGRQECRMCLSCEASRRDQGIDSMVGSMEEAQEDWDIPRSSTGKVC